jgi:hypothetical protein
MMVSDSLFKADLEALRGKAYDAVVRTAMYPRYGFRAYWKFVSETLEKDRKRTQSDFYTEMYKEYTRIDWIKSFEKWLNAKTEEEKNEMSQETADSSEVIASIPNESLLTTLRAQINDALLKDSQNRADIVLDFLQEQGDDLKSSFGSEATNLIFEIVGGLKQDEEQRLGKPKTESAPVQVAEQTDEEVIDELDFLDDDIDEVLNLKKIEEELDLDDLKLD